MRRVLLLPVFWAGLIVLQVIRVVLWLPAVIYSAATRAVDPENAS